MSKLNEEPYVGNVRADTETRVIAAQKYVEREVFTLDEALEALNLTLQQYIDGR